jgi:hypothetical protein
MVQPGVKCMGTKMLAQREMAMRRTGQIVLLRFPETDLAPGKLRPVVLIAPTPGPITT